MKKRKKTVLFLNIEQLLGDSFEHFVEDGFFNPEGHYVLVHIFTPEIRSHLPAQVNKKDDEAVNAFILRKMFEVVERVWGEPSPNWVDVEVLYHKEPKLRAVNYLRDEEADSCVVATRGEQGVSGIFKDSFAYFLVANAPCDVLILRPVKKIEEAASAN